MKCPTLILAFPALLLVDIVFVSEYSVPITAKVLTSLASGGSEAAEQQYNPYDGWPPQNSSELRQDFVFPSVEERVRYYMGGWYNQSNWKVTTDDVCERVRYYQVAGQQGKGRRNLFDQPYLFDRHNLEAALSRPKLHGGFKDYAEDALALVSQYPNSSSLSFPGAIFQFGDTTQNDAPFPIILKSRSAGKQGNNDPILAPLNSKRHYRPVDAMMMKRKNHTANSPISAEELPFSLKKETLIWRGASTGGGRRYPIVARYIDQPTDEIDIAFDKIVQSNHIGEKMIQTKRWVRRRKTVDELLSYSYLLSLEGNDVASGLKWMLYSNSVVFMSKPTRVSWAMEDKLLPFYHYIPLKDDASNLLQMVQWARQHPEETQRIADQSTQYMIDLYASEKAKRTNQLIMKRMMILYDKLYGQQLQKCKQAQ